MRAPVPEHRSSSIKPTQLRLRIFAGPNGSGKSTIIEGIRRSRPNGRPLDFGFYVNSDQIVLQLRDQGLSFSEFGLNVSADEFVRVALNSGLVADSRFTPDDFTTSFRIAENHISWKLKDTPGLSFEVLTRSVEGLAQIIADFLHKQLLKDRKKFSIETVFSHPGKLELMKAAAEAGYKVYLYFIATESAEINKFRVLTREKKGGHHVSPERIEQRYVRSLGLLFDAAQLTYQSYFIDNSADNSPANFFANFKVVDGKKEWNLKPGSHRDYPLWFISNYSDKIAGQ